MIKLSDRIYYLPYDEATDRPNLGYIRGDRFSLMIDAGNSHNHVQLFMEALEREGLKKPDFVGITHWHWDHTYGLHAVGAISIACHKTNDLLHTMSGWSFSDEAMEARIKSGEDILFCTQMIQKEYPDRNQIHIVPADLVFEEELQLDLGGITCHMIRVGGSHSEDSVIFYLPEEKFLFLGDSDSEDLHHGEPSYHPELLQKYYETVKALDFKYSLHGHWVPQTREEQLSFLEEMLEKLRSPAPTGPGYQG